MPYLGAVHFKSFFLASALLKIPEDPSVINIAPACLPTSLSTKNESFEGINCVATGWGKLKPHGKLQSDLHQVQLKVVHNKHCDTMYKMKYGIRLNQNQHLCAGPILSGGRGTCIVSCKFYLIYKDLKSFL